MNLHQTEGAPAIASETIAAPAAASPKPTRKKVKAAAIAIARRMVLAGKHKITGAPKLEVIGLTKNRRRGAFTLQDIFMANGETISLLTIKKRKNDLVQAGQLVKDIEAAKRQHEGHGRPPEYFNFDTTKGEVKTPRTRKKKSTAPIVAADPAPAEQAAAPAPEPAPVVIEQPADPAPVAEPDLAAAPAAA